MAAIGEAAADRPPHLAASESAHSMWDALPENELRRVVGFLDAPSAARLAQTSRRNATAVRHSAFWSAALERDFGVHPAVRGGALQGTTAASGWVRRGPKWPVIRPILHSRPSDAGAGPPVERPSSSSSSSAAAAGDGGAATATDSRGPVDILRTMGSRSSLSPSRKGLLARALAVAYGVRMRRARRVQSQFQTARKHAVLDPHCVSAARAIACLRLIPEALVLVLLSALLLVTFIRLPILLDLQDQAAAATTASSSSTTSPASGTDEQQRLLIDAEEIRGLLFPWAALVAGVVIHSIVWGVSAALAHSTCTGANRPGTCSRLCVANGTDDEAPCSRVAVLRVHDCTMCWCCRGAQTWMGVASAAFVLAIGCIAAALVIPLVLVTPYDASDGSNPRYSWPWLLVGGLAGGAVLFFALEAAILCSTHEPPRIDSYVEDPSTIGIEGAIARDAYQHPLGAGAGGGGGASAAAAAARLHRQRGTAAVGGAEDAAGHGDVHFEGGRPPACCCFRCCYAPHDAYHRTRRARTSSSGAATAVPAHPVGAVEGAKAEPRSHPAISAAAVLPISAEHKSPPSGSAPPGTTARIAVMAAADASAAGVGSAPHVAPPVMLAAASGSASDLHVPRAAEPVRAAAAVAIVEEADVPDHPDCTSWAVACRADTFAVGVAVCLALSLFLLGAWADGLVPGLDAGLAVAPIVAALFASAVRFWAGALGCNVQRAIQARRRWNNVLTAVLFAVRTSRARTLRMQQAEATLPDSTGGDSAATAWSGAGAPMGADDGDPLPSEAKYGAASSPTFGAGVGGDAIASSEAAADPGSPVGFRPTPQEAAPPERPRGPDGPRARRAVRQRRHSQTKRVCANLRRALLFFLAGGTVFIIPAVGVLLPALKASGRLEDTDWLHAFAPWIITCGISLCMGIVNAMRTFGAFATGDILAVGPHAAIVRPDLAPREPLTVIVRSTTVRLELDV